jgi:hypothetical protein
MPQKNDYGYGFCGVTNYLLDRYKKGNNISCLSYCQKSKEYKRNLNKTKSA